MYVPPDDVCRACALTGVQIAGPMWSGPIHDPAFVGKVLEHVEASADRYGTSARMKGMLTVAKEVCRYALIVGSVWTERSTGTYSAVLLHGRPRCGSLPLCMSVTGRDRVRRTTPAVLGFYFCH